MLIRNTARQFQATSPPPRNGPNAPATPPSPDQAPTARERSVGSNEAAMMVRLPGVSRTPPTPCNARAAISVPGSGANPHSAEAGGGHQHPPAGRFGDPQPAGHPESSR